MLKNITELETIRQEQARLAVRETELVTPELTDPELLPLLHLWFTEYSRKRNCPSRDDSVMQRRKFLIIVLVLYSPSTLIGDKLKYGLREKLRKVLNVKSPTLISNLSGEVVFYYRQYTSFRRDVTNIYYHLLQRLEWYRNQSASRP